MWPEGKVFQKGYIISLLNLRHRIANTEQTAASMSGCILSKGRQAGKLQKQWEAARGRQQPAAAADRSCWAGNVAPPGSQPPTP